MLTADDVTRVLEALDRAGYAVIKRDDMQGIIDRLGSDIDTLKLANDETRRILRQCW